MSVIGLLACWWLGTVYSRCIFFWCSWVVVHLTTRQQTILTHPSRYELRQRCQDRTLNSSYATTPVFLASIFNCQPTQSFKPERLFLSNDVVSQGYGDLIARRKASISLGCNNFATTLRLVGDKGLRY